MANIHPNPKDSPSGLSTQDSTAMYSFINSQTLPRQHSKSLLPIQHSSPPDAPINRAGPPDLHRPLSDPELLKEQHWLSRLQDITQLFHWKYNGHFKTGTGQNFNTNARFSTGTRLYIRFLCHFLLLRYAPRCCRGRFRMDSWTTLPFSGSKSIIDRGWYLSRTLLHILCVLHTFTPV